MLYILNLANEEQRQPFVTTRANISNDCANILFWGMIYLQKPGGNQKKLRHKAICGLEQQFMRLCTLRN